MHRRMISTLTCGTVFTVLLCAAPAQAAGREFSGLGVTSNGQGYLLSATSGEMYAFAAAATRANPTNFSGRVTDVTVTADGRGSLAVTSAGQFYAYGTARAQPNPTGFTGRIVRVALTGDGSGAAALSSIGQVYAHGSIVHRGNGDYGCSSYAGVEVCRDIRARYQSLGGPSGFLGNPTSGEFAAGSGRGLGMHFQGGSIYWSPGTGAHEVHGRIRDKWAATGWENGPAGFCATTSAPATSGRTDSDWTRPGNGCRR